MTTPVMHAAPSPTELVGVQLGRYQLKRHIATGGFFHVFEGYRPRAPSQRFAVKVLKGRFERDAGVTNRIERSAELLEKVEPTPHIARIIESGVSAEGYHYVVLPLLDGPDLFDWLQARTTRPSTNTAIRILRDLMRALAALERAGIVHRDVKLENVVITKAGVVLVDFELCTLADRQDVRVMTSIEQVIGTWSLTAPEQLEGRVETRTDVHAAALVLNQVLAGCPLSKARNATIALRPDAPPELGTWLARMLASTPQLRPGAQEVLEWCDDVLRGEPPTCNPADDIIQRAPSSNEDAAPPSPEPTPSPPPRGDRTTPTVILPGFFGRAFEGGTTTIATAGALVVVVVVVATLAYLLATLFEPTESAVVPSASRNASHRWTEVGLSEDASRLEAIANNLDQRPSQPTRLLCTQLLQVDLRTEGRLRYDPLSSADRRQAEWMHARSQRALASHCERSR